VEKGKKDVFDVSDKMHLSRVQHEEAFNNTKWLLKVCDSAVFSKSIMLQMQASLTLRMITSFERNCVFLKYDLVGMESSLTPMRWTGEVVFKNKSKVGVANS
jgi:hypothetical protein